MFTLANNFFKWVKKRQEKSMTIILLGLDNAGKSTLLFGLKNEFPKSDMTPTIGFRPSKLVSGKYTIQWFDVGGAKNFRRVWQNYYSEVHGIIYVVDGADAERLDESKETLRQLLESEGISGKPVLIFANKQDLNGCIAPAELSEKLGLLEKKDCRYQVHACQAKPKEGGGIDSRINRGLRWLLDSIESNYRTLNTRVERETEEMKAREKQKKEEQKKRAETNKALRLKEQEQAETVAAAELAAGGKGQAESSQPAPAAPPPEIVVEGAGAEGLDIVNKAPLKDDAAASGNRVSPVDGHTTPLDQGGASSAVKAPAKLEVEGGADAVPSSRGRLPALAEPTTNMRSNSPLQNMPAVRGAGSPAPKLNDLKPMPPQLQISAGTAKAANSSQEMSLPNSIPSPESKWKTSE